MGISLRKTINLTLKSLIKLSFLSYLMLLNNKVLKNNLINKFTFLDYPFVSISKYIINSLKQEYYNKILKEEMSIMR